MVDFQRKNQAKKAILNTQMVSTNLVEVIYGDKGKWLAERSNA